MTFALAITGLTAACVAGNATLMQFILGNQAVFLGLIIAELVVAFTLIGRVSKLSFTNASLLFILYSILTGATLSTIFSGIRNRFHRFYFLRHCRYIRSHVLSRIFHS